MPVTYQLLIAEHDEIDSAADDLFHAAIGPKVTSQQLAARLNGLAKLVAEHTARESEFVSGLDQDHLVGCWIDDWKKGLIEFDQLGSGLIGHSQKMTVAASATAEKKTVGQRS